MDKADQSNDLLRIITSLREHDVAFVVCGGVACVLHGVNRVTQDIDIFVRLTDDNLRRFIDVAHSMNLTPRMPEPLETLRNPEARERWRREKGAKVVTLNAPDSPFQVDIFLDYPIAYDELFAESVQMTISDIVFNVSSVQHLIQAKQSMTPPRRTDLRDIEDLLEIQKRVR